MGTCCSSFCHSFLPRAGKVRSKSERLSELTLLRAASLYGQCLHLGASCSLYQKLPKVNKELALKLIEEEEEKQKSTLKKKVKVRRPEAEKASVSRFAFSGQ